MSLASPLLHCVHQLPSLLHNPGDPRTSLHHSPALRLRYVRDQSCASTSPFHPITLSLPVLPIHQLLDLLLVFLDILEIKHGTEDMIPQGGADPISHMFILVVMEMVIAPVISGPAKRRAPGMNGIMDTAIQQIPQHEAGKEWKG